MKIRISVRNCTKGKMSINKEPEAIEEFIDANDEIEIETNEQEDNIAINIGKNDDGTIYIQVWNSLNTCYTIYHEGRDMFEEYL